MDTSEEYIEMCKKAEEIQKYSQGVDDYSYRPISVTPDGNWFYIKEIEVLSYKCVWLPRQDQLIEMNIQASRVKYNYANFDDFGIIKDMMEYTDYAFKTFEQFLLNEYMVTKYDKHWNGKDWVV